MGRWAGSQCGGWGWKDGQMGETSLGRMGRWMGPQCGRDGQGG